MEIVYKAHINEATKQIQTVKEHSENTAGWCRKFAIPVLKDFMYDGDSAPHTLGFTFDKCKAIWLLLKIAAA